MMPKQDNNNIWSAWGSSAAAPDGPQNQSPPCPCGQEENCPLFSVNPMNGQCINFGQEGCYCVNNNDDDQDDDQENEDQDDEEKEEEGEDEEQPEEEEGADSEDPAEGGEAEPAGGLGEGAGADAAAGGEAGAMAGAEGGAVGGAAVGEGGAVAAAEGGEAAAGIIEILAATWEIWVPILVIVVLAAIIFLGFMVKPDSSAGTEHCTSTNLSSLNLGSPNAEGYYQLPKSPNYDLNVNGGSPRSSQWGGKTLIETINVVAATWNSKHPTERLGIGDLNAPGHKSHKRGIDADIYSRNDIFMSLPGHKTNKKYNKDLAIELGKLFADTKSLDTIFYDDQAVVTAVNKYINEQNLPGKFSLLSEHDDHFHLRVNDGTTPNGNICPDTSSGSGSGPSQVSGTLAELKKKYKEYRTKNYITVQSIGDADGDVASGKVKAQTIRTLLQMADFLHSKNQTLQISVMVTGHKSGTLHGVGLAFDIGNETVAKYLMPWAKQNASSLALDELIFDNSLIGKGSNYYNLKKGKTLDYPSGTISQHRNHIHVGVFDK